MMLKRMSGMLVALIVSVGVLSSCGSADEASSSSKVDSVPANEVLQSEFDKLSTFADSDSGTIKIRLSVDTVGGTETATWDALVSSVGEQFTSGASSTSVSDLEYDLDLSASAGWGTESNNFALNIGETQVIALGSDSENYYVDLTSLKPLGEAFGLTDESFSALGLSASSIFGKIKVPVSEVNAFASSAGSSADIKGEILSKTTGLTSNEGVSSALDSLMSKADYGDDNSIQITGLTLEDLTPLVDAIKAVDSDDSSSMLDIDESMLESEDGSAKLKNLDYTLEYSDKGISQTHTIKMTSTEGDIITLEVVLQDKPSDFDVSTFAEALSFEDVFGTDFTTFVSGIMGQSASGTPEDIYAE